MLLEPTSVVFNSFPVVVICCVVVAVATCETAFWKLLTKLRPPPAPAVMPMTLVAAAGDCEGLGWKTTVPALGLPFVY